jgi:hypothetical protein
MDEQNKRMPGTENIDLILYGDRVYVRDNENETVLIVACTNIAEMYPIDKDNCAKIWNRLLEMERLLSDSPKAS